MSRHEVRNHVGFHRTRLEHAQGLDIRVEWTPRFVHQLRGWDVEVFISNQSDQRVEIDWDRTVFIGPDRQSLRVVTGETRVLHSNISAPPTVLPVGSHGSWELFRTDTLDLRRPKVTTPMLMEWPGDKEMSLHLACRRGGVDSVVVCVWKMTMDAAAITERRRAVEAAKNNNRRIWLIGSFAVALIVVSGSAAACLFPTLLVLGGRSASQSEPTSLSAAELQQLERAATNHRVGETEKLDTLFDDVRLFHQWAETLERPYPTSSQTLADQASKAVSDAQERAFPILRDRLGPLARAAGDGECRTSGSGYRTLTIDGGRNQRHALANVWGTRFESTSPWHTSYRHWMNCLRFSTVVVKPREGAPFTINLSAPSDKAIHSTCGEALQRSNLKGHMVEQGMLNPNGTWR